VPRFTYLNNIIEQDHRFIKKRITASLGFRSPERAWTAIEGYEAMHMIRKGQVRRLDKGDVSGQRQFIHNLFGNRCVELGELTLTACRHSAICNRTAVPPKQLAAPICWTIIM